MQPILHLNFDKMFMYQVSQKIVPKSVVYFEAAKLLMSEILVLLDSLELCNSFGTLFVCFHSPMNNLCRCY